MGRLQPIPEMLLVLEDALVDSGPCFFLKTAALDGFVEPFDELCDVVEVLLGCEELDDYGDAGGSEVADVVVVVGQHLHQDVEVDLLH